VIRRDENGRFRAKAKSVEGTDGEGHAVGELEPGAAGASVLERHRAALEQLRSNYEEVSRLGEQLSGIEAELGQIGQTESELAQRLWDGESFEEGSLERLHTRVLILQRMGNKLRKEAEEAEKSLQQRLRGDILACERLAGHWLGWRLEAESLLLLESVIEQRREEVELQSACRCLAAAGIAYKASYDALGAAASLSYAWQRPLCSESARSPAAQRIADPLYSAPARSEIVRELLRAAALLILRWERLLEQVEATSGGFELPSYEEAPPAAVDTLAWNEALDRRSVIERELARLGKSWEELSEPQRGILRRMELEHQSWRREAKAAQATTTPVELELKSHS